jgi:hypothetical protein
LATPIASAIAVDEVKTEVIELAILGTMPLILNRMSEKARHELLLPSGRKTTADRASSLKHDPIAEFRSSPYLLVDDDEPTYLAGLAAWFKGAVMTAALRVPGAKKTEIGQLLWIQGERIPLYGVPEVFTAITRDASINRTPDVRTRAIVPKWATTIRVELVVPLLNSRSVTNLFAAAGKVAGVGDWRPEKGKGTYGQFEIVDPDDERFRSIIERGGRAQQMGAMANPTAYDEETADLLEWFDVEVELRGKRRAA